MLDGSCYKCGNSMKISWMRLNNGDYGFITPSEFNENEINFAKSKGVLLEMRYSRTANERYLANICPDCRAFVGDWFLFDDYIIEYMYDENLPKYDMGYYCDNE